MRHLAQSVVFLVYSPRPLSRCFVTSGDWSGEPELVDWASEFRRLQESEEQASHAHDHPIDDTAGWDLGLFILYW